MKQRLLSLKDIEIVLKDDIIKTYRMLFGRKYSMVKRKVLWDMSLAEKAESIHLKMHRPVRKNVILECGEPWEGETCGYGQIMHDGEKYRLYYRACGSNKGPANLGNGRHAAFCVAYSTDGKHFEKPDLGIYEYDGSRHNNIIFMNEDKSWIDNFAIFIDTNPNCPPNAKYKALSGYLIKGKPENSCLKVYQSADGLHFEEVSKILEGKGAFDSMNIAFWDESIQKYRLYMRDYHSLNTEYQIEYEEETHVRDVRVTYSDDFVSWSEPMLIDFGDDKTEIQIYTNGMMKYARADMFLGFPTRYINRTPDKVNYKYLPDLHGLREYLREKEGRSATAITDAFVMMSKDGVHFQRTREAFLTPGPENGENWVYGDCYIVHGLVQTQSDFYGESDELSIYTGKGYRARPVSFERYTLRLDGLFSWRADYEDGTVITKPIAIEGDRLSVNFSTSALGYLRIELLDENENVLDGYDSGRLFGDSTSRPVEFEKPLNALLGQQIKMKITMRDADFYSFCFEE